MSLGRVTIGTVAALSIGLALWAFWPTGTVRWQSVTAADGHLVLFDARELMELRTVEGQTVWQADEAGREESLVVHARLADERLFSVFTEGDIWTLDVRNAQTGSSLWAREVRGGLPGTKWALAGELVLVIERRQRGYRTLRALSSASGQEVWSVDLGTEFEVGWVRGDAAVVAGDGRVVQIRLSDGEIVRRTDSAGVCVLDDEVWTTSGEGNEVVRAELHGTPLPRSRLPTSSAHILACGTHAGRAVVLHSSTAGASISWFDRSTHVWLASIKLDPDLHVAAQDIALEGFNTERSPWRPAMADHVVVAGDRPTRRYMPGVVGIDLAAMKVSWQSDHDLRLTTVYLGLDEGRLFQRFLGGRDLLVGYSLRTGRPVSARELSASNVRYALHNGHAFQAGAAWIIQDGAPVSVPLGDPDPKALRSLFPVQKPGGGHR